VQDEGVSDTADAKIAVKRFQNLQLSFEIPIGVGQGARNTNYRVELRYKESPNFVYPSWLCERRILSRTRGLASLRDSLCLRKPMPVFDPKSLRRMLERQQRNGRSDDP
jgi:hypothetical protein